MVGKPGQKPAVIVSAIVKDSAAAQFGLSEGDQIVAINGQRLLDQEDKLLIESHAILLKEIKGNPNKEITLQIIRDDKETALPVKLGSKKDGELEIGSLGAVFETPIQKLPFFQAIKTGIAMTNQWIYNIAFAVKSLISQRSLEGAGGPVMILSQSFSSATHGATSLFIFLALISINLALMNILPIGALDGGQLLFVTIEALIGRRIPDSIKIAINLASWAFFISLALLLTYQDIKLLFGSKLKALWGLLCGSPN
jgi:regulator of sigma E protease